MKNIFADIPDNLKDEFFETLLETTDFRIERIISQGHASGDEFWYDQDENEWIILLEGGAVLRFADKGKLVVLHPGDYLNIPPRHKHRVEWTDPNQQTVWLAIYYK